MGHPCKSVVAWREEHSSNSRVGNIYISFNLYLTLEIVRKLMGPGMFAVVCNGLCACT